MPIESEKGSIGLVWGSSESRLRPVAAALNGLDACAQLKPAGISHRGSGCLAWLEPAGDGNRPEHRQPGGGGEGDVDPDDLGRQLQLPLDTAHDALERQAGRSVW